MNAIDPAALNRRDFISLAAIGALGLGIPRTARAASAHQLFCVGTYTTDGRSKGVYLLRMARDSGTIAIVGLIAATSNPSFIAMSADGQTVYTVNEVSELDGVATGGVSAFMRERSTNALLPLGSEPSGGAAPCYAAMDRGGRFLFVANYAGGSISVFPVFTDGNIGAATSFVQHTGRGADAKRQAGPHAHCIIPDPANRFVLVADLGLDRIIGYTFNAHAGTLTRAAVAGAMVASGAGPRHLAFHPDGRTLYVTNELDSTIGAFRYHPTTGALTELQTLPAVSETMTTRNAPADVHVHPSGRFVYVSNRGHDSIASFAIDRASGTLRPVELTATRGNWPRNFSIDPQGRFLLVANQRSDSITSFRINQRNGRLTPTGSSATLAAPVCIRAMPGVG